MRYKASFMMGLATGYVLGARAGRERYEQIRRTAQSAWSNPQVQRTAGSIPTQAGQFVSSAARVAADKGRAVSHKVGDKLPPRLVDKLPAKMRHHEGEDWQYARAGHAHNGHGTAPSPGPTPSTGPTGPVTP